MKTKLTIKLSIIAFTLSLLIFGFTTSTAAKSKKVQYLGRYKLTAYCGCRSCSGGWGNRTASGKRAKQGRTIAVDRRKIKLGTKIKINGKTYRAEDVGGGVKGKHIDIYFSSHSKVRKFGRRYAKVYRIK